MVQIYALCVGYLELDRASMLSDLSPGAGTPARSVTDHPLLLSQETLICETGA